MLNQDQHEIALPLTKGKITVVLGQYENHYWRLQQAYDVWKCLAEVYFSETDKEKLVKLENARVHAHAPVLPSHLSLKANDCDLLLVDDDLTGDAQESDDSSDSSDCSNISDSESLSSDDLIIIFKLDSTYRAVLQLIVYNIINLKKRQIMWINSINNKKNYSK